ncbi:MAG: hypothetical protein F6K30_09855 [Cyanothece sp. SIO2G6]|nr:hypothetical protein [Cyanothece sp. SIO2G6]
MSSFWPKGIELTDTQSPREILKIAQQEWQIGSDGVMELLLQDTKSQVGNPMIVVHAKHTPSNRIATLFSVVYRPNSPYPATIQSEHEDLPDFLKKSYQKTTKSFFKTTSEIFGDIEENVTNPWVADTPSEFRKKLSDVFNLGSIKSIIINLVSTSTKDTGTS